MSEYGQARFDEDRVKGVYLDEIETKYGTITKVGINLEQFAENPINDKGYVNFEIKRSKKGNIYSTLNRYKKPAVVVADNDESVMDFADDIDEIPF